jgi:HPt (histidine-containing phosphotransfer) domain-containing protein
MLEDLRKALAARDAEKFRRTAHSLKSNSNTFGAVALGALAKELELAGVEQVIASKPGALDALGQEYQRTAAALKEIAHA